MATTSDICTDSLLSNVDQVYEDGKSNLAPTIAMLNTGCNPLPTSSLHTKAMELLKQDYEQKLGNFDAKVSRRQTSTSLAQPIIPFLLTLTGMSLRPLMPAIKPHMPFSFSSMFLRLPISRAPETPRKPNLPPRP
ncbi:hypothetical protein CCACVL1_15210 [Corchorus capsularis]|uniref:Uncharacterized protein n=1 Tax=Corchorus capsularis TaxID=210143 RepID=A0A1R3I3C4_COCAP|nr:hypothetical protein CCACVL1_15210 [Corchorus capsularis]